MGSDYAYATNHYKPRLNLRERLNWLERGQIEEILENNGFACYDHESTDELREALAVNIEDDTIDVSVLESYPVPD